MENEDETRTVTSKESRRSLIPGWRPTLMAWLLWMLVPPFLAGLWWLWQAALLFRKDGFFEAQELGPSDLITASLDAVTALGWMAAAYFALPLLAATLLLVRPKEAPGPRLFLLLSLVEILCFAAFRLEVWWPTPSFRGLVTTTALGCALLCCLVAAMFFYGARFLREEPSWIRDFGPSRLVAALFLSTVLGGSAVWFLHAENTAEARRLDDRAVQLREQLNELEPVTTEVRSFKAGKNEIQEWIDRMSSTRPLVARLPDVLVVAQEAHPTVETLRLRSGVLEVGGSTTDLAKIEGLEAMIQSELGIDTTVVLSATGFTVELTADALQSTAGAQAEP